MLPTPSPTLRSPAGTTPAQRRWGHISTQEHVPYLGGGARGYAEIQQQLKRVAHQHSQRACNEKVQAKGVCAYLHPSLTAAADITPTPQHAGEGALGFLCRPGVESGVPVLLPLGLWPCCSSWSLLPGTSFHLALNPVSSRSYGLRFVYCMYLNKNFF